MKNFKKLLRLTELQNSRLKENELVSLKGGSPNPPKPQCLCSPTVGSPNANTGLIS